MQDADLVLLVTEPTPFGLNDLRLTVEVLRELQSDFAVVLNRAGGRGDPTTEYCSDEGIPILARIPNDRMIAEGYSRGVSASETGAGYRPLFEDLLHQVLATVASP
ncbi:MAG: hypothetical protein GY704_01285 [Phycisphaeraceae bacterium]|nr:hypothetical protein [Phycisphaeraceae bacterium]